MTNKRSELATILRRLADYIDNHPDATLAPIFEQAAALMRTPGGRQKRQGGPSAIFGAQDAEHIVDTLQTLRSREAGESLLQNGAPNRQALEMIARSLRLPVQRDDTVDRLRAKIVENTIGSRLRSEAIQGGPR